MDSPWKAYSERTRERPPRELLVKAVAYVPHKGHALDLGPGALNESKYLLEQGFQSVVAVNKDPLETDPVAQSRAATFPKDRFAYRVSAFDAFDFLVDYINHPITNNATITPQLQIAIGFHAICAAVSVSFVI